MIITTEEEITIPRSQYEQLLRDSEMLEDIVAFDEGKASLNDGVPAEVLDRILDGEVSMLKGLREWRELTQMGLSELSGVNRVQIANIEAGNAKGSADTLVKLAYALGQPVDLLIG